MNWKIWAAILAGTFLLIAAYLFSPEQAMEMLKALVGAFGGAP